MIGFHLEIHTILSQLHVYAVLTLLAIKNTRKSLLQFFLVQKNCPQKLVKNYKDLKYINQEELEEFLIF